MVIFLFIVYFERVSTVLLGQDTVHVIVSISRLSRTAAAAALLLLQCCCRLLCGGVGGGDFSGREFLREGGHPLDDGGPIGGEVYLLLCRCDHANWGSLFAQYYSCSCGRSTAGKRFPPLLLLLLMLLLLLCLPERTTRLKYSPRFFEGECVNDRSERMLTKKIILSGFTFLASEFIWLHLGIIYDEDAIATTGVSPVMEFDFLLLDRCIHIYILVKRVPRPMSWNGECVERQIELSTRNYMDSRVEIVECLHVRIFLLD